MLNNPSSMLIRKHLESSLRELESEAENNRHHTICIRSFAEAATLLGHSDFVDRAVRLLQAVPDNAFWEGVITNVDRSKFATFQWRSVDAPEELEKRYPIYSEENIGKCIRANAKTEAHFALCLEGRFQQACLKAGSGRPLEEVGLTFAVFGEFDRALRVARGPALEAFRQKGVLLVLAIEYFRHKRIKEGEEVLAELESRGLGAWERIQLVLGFAGREPWSGYPFPDW